MTNELTEAMKSFAGFFVPLLDSWSYFQMEWIFLLSFREKINQLGYLETFVGCSRLGYKQHRNPSFWPAMARNTYLFFVKKKNVCLAAFCLDNHICFV